MEVVDPIQEKVGLVKGDFGVRAVDGYIMDGETVVDGESLQRKIMKTRTGDLKEKPT